MWSVVLKILSILGIILLCLLFLLLLVLFMPVVYRGGGSACGEAYEAWFRFRWLFGLVRGEFTYPQGKALRVRVLWLTVFDSGRGRKSNPEDMVETAAETAEHAAQAAGKAAEKTAEAAENAFRAEQKCSDADRIEETSATAAGNLPFGAKPRKLWEKINTLKDRLQRCLSILRDQENQELVNMLLSRGAKLFKSIRPRILRAEAVVGLGEPDTTGYLYGAYWAVKPFLGKKCRVEIIPDFERQILEGKIILKGRIVTAVPLYQIIRVLPDQRLQRLLRQLRKIKGEK